MAELSPEDTVLKAWSLTCSAIEKFWALRMLTLQWISPLTPQNCLGPGELDPGGRCKRASGGYILSLVSDIFPISLLPPAH